MGRAEVLRLLMSYIEMPFNDVYIKLNDWKNHKKSMVNGLVPNLEFENGKKMGETVDIAMYIGKLGGLNPKDP